MSFVTINPATGEFVNEFPLQSDAEVRAALDTTVSTASPSSSRGVPTMR